MATIKVPELFVPVRMDAVTKSEWINYAELGRTPREARAMGDVTNKNNPPWTLLHPIMRIARASIEVQS